MGNPIKFTDLIQSEKWRDFEEHAKTIDEILTKDISLAIKENKRIATEVRELLEKEFEIKQCNEDTLKLAETVLFNGQVAAIDGTHAVYPLLSGIRCRVGIACTNYIGKCTTGVVLVSEQQVMGEETSILGILKRRKKSEKLISRMLIQAIMFYKEREIGLQRPEEWIMLNGPLVPQPLRTGIGSFRALDTCLEICRNIIDCKKVVAVQASSTDDEIISLGLALRTGEYLNLRSYGEEMDNYLEESGLRGNDRVIMDEFNRIYADRFRVGVYRAGGKAYMFQAPEEHFEEAANLIQRDSMYQPIRGYPLLIDYADALCSRLLTATDFKKMVEFKLAKGKGLEMEQPEQNLRRK